MNKEIVNMIKEIIISKKIQSYMLVNLGILTVIFKINSNLVKEGRNFIINVLPSSVVNIMQVFMNNIRIIILILSYGLFVLLVSLLAMVILLKLGESYEKINTSFLMSIINFLVDDLVTVSNITLILHMINIINTNKAYSEVGQASFIMIISVYSITFINYIFSK